MPQIKITAPPPGAPAPAVDPQVAMENWLHGFLAGAPLVDAALRQAAADFAAVTGAGNFAQTKAVFAALLAATEKRRPADLQRIFATFSPTLLARTGELPLAEGRAERATLMRGEMRLSITLKAPTLSDEELAVQLAALPSPPVAIPVPTGPGLNVREAQHLGRLGAVADPKLQLSAAQTGVFWGRLLGKATTPALDRALDAMVTAGLYQRDLTDGLIAGTSYAKIAPQRLRRLGAAFYLLRVSEGLLPTAPQVEAVLDAARALPPGTDTTYQPVQSSADAVIEHAVFGLLQQTAPAVAAAVVAHHPHLYNIADTPAYAELCDELAAEHGRFLEGYNLGAVMHHMGQAVPFLDGLVTKLGLDPTCYVGADVPYSGSPLAHAALAAKGLTVHTDHDPRAQASLHDWLTGPRRLFDDLKAEEIERNIERLLALHRQNGKPILVIDDGGYVAKILRQRFPNEEHLFKIVEWTTRGLRLYESIPNPKTELLAAAASQPKVELEPAFIADSVVENIVVHLRERFGDHLRGRSMLLVGYGNIGAAVQQALEGLGMKVSVYDRDPDKLRRAGRHAVPRLDDAVAGKDVVVGATGANSLPPEVFRLASPNTLFISASSVDIETRSQNPADNGTWQVGLTRIAVRIGPDVRFDEKSWKAHLARQHPANRVRLEALRQSYALQLRQLGLGFNFEFRDVARGGFPVNLTGALQTMELSRQELPLMNVVQALAELHDPNNRRQQGQNRMRPAGERRIVEIYARHHPEQYQRALEFSRD